MKHLARWQNWLLWTAATVFMLVAALAVRGRLRDWTKHELNERLARLIASLPEEQAAAEVRRLADLDADAPTQLVPLLMDEREHVATAAQQGVELLVADWRHAGGDDAAPRIARLARELADIAPRLPRERIGWAQALATRLLLWPIHDGDLSTQIVSDCELVLRLPVSQPSEARAAALDRIIEPVTVDIPAPPPIIKELPGPLPAASPTDEDTANPRVYGPVEPDRLPDASTERPERPKQFLPPRAMRIDG